MKLRRAFITASALIVAAVLALAAGTSWLTRTESGARWLLERALAGSVPAEALAGVTGDFASGVLIPRLELEVGGAGIEIESARIRTSIRWLDTEIVVQQLSAETLRIRLRPDAAGDTSATGPAGSLTAPVAMRFERIRIDGLDVLGANGESLVGPVSLQGQAQWHQALSVDVRIEAEAGWRLDTQGSMTLDGRLEHHLEASLWPGTEWLERLGLGDGRYSIDIRGDADASGITLANPDAGVAARGELRPSPDGMVWQAQAGLDTWALPGEFDGPPPLVLSGLRVSAEGQGSDYRLSADTEAATPGLAPLALRASASGNAHQLQLDALHLDSAQLSAETTGHLSLAGERSIELDTRISRLEPDSWLASWPGGHPLAGRATLFWSGSRIELTHLALDRPGHDERLAGSGVLDTGTGHVEGRLEWTHLRWPLDGPARLESASGSATLGGQWDDWHAAGRLDLRAEGYPKTRLALDATGTRRDARLRLDEARMLGGVVSGEFEVDWHETLSWQGRLTGRDIDPAPVWPDWPGRLNLSASVNSADNGQLIGIRLERLSGTLVSQPVEGRGGITLDGGTPTFDGLRLASGTSYVELDGSTEDGIDFDLAAHGSPLLSRWLRGDVTGNGRIRWRDGMPVAELDLRASGLETGWLKLQRASVKGTFDPASPDARSIWRAENIFLDEWHIESVEAELATVGDQQRLEARLAQGRHLLELVASGMLSSGQSAAAWGGKGLLQALAWHLDNERQITLDAPAAFELAPGNIKLGDLCLGLDRGGRACGNVHWQQNQAIDIEARVDALPVKSLAALAGHEIAAGHQLAGDFWWTYPAGARPSGQADFRLLSAAGDPEETLPEPGEFRFRLEDGELTEGRLFLPIPGAGEADIDFAITDFRLDGNGRLQGRARLDIDDLSFLQEFVSGVVPTSGQLDLDTRLGGRVAEPHLEGGIVLEGARFDIPALDLEGIALSLSGEVTRTDRLFLEGTIASGPGQAEVKAVINVADWNAPQAGLTLKGERLLLIDVPSLHALADPDLHLAWQQGTFVINGTLTIPEARISPAGSISTTVSESEDVEIVAGSLPGRPNGRERSRAPVNGRLELSLGDKVRVDMPAIKMAGSGELALEWQGSWIPQATGQVLLNGELRTYGPRLLVEQGPVRFSGRAIDDPALDIRAERDILGNTQIRTAGVHVRGSIKQPKIEAYTVPLTNEDRAWTLLLTGSDYQYGQGIGAFDIGTYVAPRLYLSYGVSLFDDERVVSARYDLRKGLGIKATASQEDNGIDASFTVER